MSKADRLRRVWLEQAIEPCLMERAL